MKCIAPISAPSMARFAALPSGRRLSILLPVRRTKFENGLLRKTERYDAIEPTLGAMDISLSLRITTNWLRIAPALFERLVGQAARQRPVAEHGNDGLVTAGQIARLRHAECGGNRRAGVAGAERIVRRLAAHREAGESAALADRAEALAAAGQNLVDVRLMADVPHQLVRRKVEHAMERERELDDAEVGSQVAAVDGTRADEKVANLAREDVNLVAPEALDVLGRVDPLDHHWPGYTHLRPDALRAGDHARG